MNMTDDRFIPFFSFNPIGMIPTEPCIALLIEHIQGFVAEFAELGAPTRAALYGFIRQYLSNHVNFLSIVDLIPDALQDFTKCGIIREAAIHQPRHIFQAHVSIF